MADSPENPALAPHPSPLRELLSLALPTVAQMASYTIMQFIDTWMLSRVGPDAPTAAANSGMMSLSVLSLGMGVLWIVNTLASQAYGRGDFGDCGKYLWQGIWFAFAYWLITLPTLWLARPMFEMFGHAPHIAALETTYFNIVVSAAIIKLISTAFAQFLMATNHPGAVLISAGIGVSVNAIAAWIMVFGHFGVRPMGIAGAAAQNIGVTCELLGVVAFSLLPQIRAVFHTLDFRPRWRELRMLLTIGLPSGGQFIADILAWSLFCNVVIGLLGESAMAANTYMLRYMTVSFMPAIGLSIAVTALVGRYIGMGQPDTAMKCANLGFFVTVTYMFGCGIFFFLGRRVLIAIFTTDSEVIRIGAMYMTFCAIYQAFDAMYIIYNGALRGAGDTFIPAVITGGLCWSMTVAGGYLIALNFPHFVCGPWTISTIYGVILGFFMFTRFRRGKWREIRLHTAASNASAGLESVG